jgi:hypothetical protein
MPCCETKSVLGMLRPERAWCHTPPGGGGGIAAVSRCYVALGLVAANSSYQQPAVCSRGIHAEALFALILPASGKVCQPQSLIGASSRIL